MTKNLTLTEASKRLPRIADEIEHDPRRVVGLRRRGKRVMTLVSAERYDALVETLEVLANKTATAKVRQALRELSNGESIPWKSARRRLGLGE